MKLEIKHLFTYLPYNIKYAFRCAYDHKNDYESIVNYQNINELELILDNSEYYLLLHPLSDLTKEIEVNGEKFVPIEKLKLLYPEYPLLIDEDSIFFTDGCELNMLEITQINEIFQKLYSWHFDLHDLIKTGLAIDINTLKN